MYRKFRVGKEIDINKLTSSQLDGFFVGCVLGDGCIRNGRYSFNFTSSDKEFIDFIEYIIRKNTNFKIYRGIQKNKDRDGYKCRESHTINIYEKAYFKKLYDILYKDGKRVITEKALQKLNSLAIAIWYMSDGSIVLNGVKSGNIKKRIVSIATHAYTEKENKMIARFFKEGLDIDVSVKNRKQYYFIGFPVKEAQKLFSLIFKYSVKCMYYKFDLVYPDGLYNITECYQDIHDTVKKLRSHELCDMI
jgi:hypothetical protein